MSAGDRVSAGETVVAEDGAAATFHIRGRAAMKLKNSGKLVFDDIGDTVSLRLDYGSLMTVVSRTDKKFVITTPAVTTGVRGTAFYMESRSIDQTYVCLCEGVLALSSSSDTVLEIRAPGAGRSKHTPVMVSLDPTGVMRVQVSTMLNHTNADIEALETVLKK